MHVWLTGRANLLRLFQRTLFRQADPVSGDAVHTAVRTAICLTGDNMQGESRKGQNNSAGNNSS